MIEVQLPNIKFDFWKSSDQRLFDLALAGIQLHQVRCPKCGAIGCCTPFKSYQRMMITISGGSRTNTRIVVPRVRCFSCGHTHPDSRKSDSLRLLLRSLCSHHSARIPPSSWLRQRLLQSLADFHFHSLRMDSSLQPPLLTAFGYVPPYPLGDRAGHP